MTSILVVAPHPDDETLGAGGLLLKYRVIGWNINWLILTNMKEEYGWRKDQITKRNIEIQKVTDQYSFDNVFNLELEPAGLDKYPKSDLLKMVSSIITDIKPHTVIIPWKSDPHTDHQIAYQLMISATKSFRYPYIKRVLAMEILSETNFGEMEDLHPNYFVDISEYLDKKIEIMKIYESELGEHPYPRSVDSIKSLAILRGSQAGCKYAEAFKIIKWIE